MSLQPGIAQLASSAFDSQERLTIIGIFGGLAVLMGWLALRRFRRRAILRAMPTTPIAGAFVGEIEIQGKAAPSEPVIAYLSHLQCACYSWTVSEHWTRTRVVTVRDSKGRTSTRVVTEHGEDVIASGGDRATLEVEDETGRIRVLWDGASIDQCQLLNCDVEQDDPLYYGKAPRMSVAGSDGVRTFSEVGIPVGTKLYVVGFAREREDIVDLEIAAGGRKGTATQGATARMFVISNRTEQAITAGHGWAGWIHWVLGLVAICGTVLCDFSQNPQARLTQFPWTAFLAVTGYLLAFGIAWALSTLNELIDVRNRVRRASSNIDVQLKRRADLIRGVVECVVGMRSHERSLQESVAMLRAQASVVSRLESKVTPKAVGPTCLALAEGFPSLVASEVFLGLQRTLADSEARIALARDEFNGNVRGYNTRIAVFPASLVAQAARMGPARFFEAESFARAVPKA